MIAQTKVFLSKNGLLNPQWMIILRLKLNNDTVDIRTMCVQNCVMGVTVVSTHGLWPLGQGLVSQMVFELITETSENDFISLLPLNFCSNDPIRSQFCTCHDSSAAKLWPDLSITIYLKSIYGFTRSRLGVHHLFMKLILGQATHNKTIWYFTYG